LAIEELAKWMKQLETFVAEHPLSAPETGVNASGTESHIKGAKVAQKPVARRRGRSKAKG
jgi:hypothetical protein